VEAAAAPREVHSPSRLTATGERRNPRVPAAAIRTERSYTDRNYLSDKRKSKYGNLTYAVGRLAMAQGTEKITLRLPERFLKAVDFLVEVDDFPSRSEAVRAAIRDFVYARVELVGEKLKRMQEAEKAMAEAERLRKQFLAK